MKMHNSPGLRGGQVERYRERRKRRLRERYYRADSFDEKSMIATLLTRMDDGEPGDMRWITSDNGEHMLINNNGEVVAGAGGALNGKKYSNAKSTSKPVKVQPGKAKRYPKGKAKGGENSSSTFAARPHKIVDASDISKTYKGQRDTKSVIEAQGFGGLPKIVDQDEFDKAVKESGFIAQRTYTASDQETLDKYQQMLYDGDFYVDCTDGGAQYGQGMYCAADYNGELTDGITAEMEHYQMLGRSRAGKEAADKAQEEWENAGGETRKSVVEWAKSVVRAGNQSTFGAKRELQAALNILKKPPTQKEILGVQLYDKELNRSGRSLDAARDAAKGILKKYFGSSSEAQKRANCVIEAHRAQVKPIRRKAEEKARAGVSSYTETVTLDKSAKIVTYDKISRMQQSEGRNDYSIRKMDVGAYAAMKGYDAINAEGHGQSGSYTVVLNRTKMVMLNNRGHVDAAEEAGDTWEFRTGKNGIIYAYKNGKKHGWIMTSSVNKKAS